MLYVLLLALVQFVSLSALILWGLMLMVVCIHAYRTYVPAEPGETRIAHLVRKAQLNGSYENEVSQTKNLKNNLRTLTIFGVIMFLLVLSYLTNPHYQTPLLAYTGIAAAIMSFCLLVRSAWVRVFLGRRLKRPMPAWLTQFMELVMVAVSGGAVMIYALCVMAFKAGII